MAIKKKCKKERIRKYNDRESAKICINIVMSYMNVHSGKRTGLHGVSLRKKELSLPIDKQMIKGKYGATPQENQSFS